jgi:F0F1-type ATP synthase membrane subunit b/b'
MRDEKADLIIANAKKQGYKLKKEIREDNTIKLVLQKRIY